MRWIDAPVGTTKCLAVGGSSIISIKLSLPTATTNPGGRNGAYTRSMESTAGTGIGFGRQLFCYWWHMVPVYGTGQRTNRRGIDL